MRALPVGVSPVCPPIVVLDTNAVFDWLVFADPGCAPLAAAIAAGRLRWLATAAMRDECLQVLARGSLDRWQPDSARIGTAWERFCERVDDATTAPAPAPTAPNLRCTDPSDQMFIDLAVASRARWLVSKDRAVQRLAVPLRRLGTTVLTPANWAAEAAAAFSASTPPTSN